MVTMADVTGVIQSFMVVKDLVQANSSFRNFNELASAVADVNTKLMHFLTAAVEAKEKELALNHRISELEKENEQLKNWDRECERYQLTALATGAFTYSLKPGMEQGEPAHHLCAHCFQQREKCLLQPMNIALSNSYVCHRCKNQIHMSLPDSETSGVVAIREDKRWRGY